MNPQSGGEGMFKGGDGVVREMLFRKKQTLSVLTERRVLQPYGLKGKTLSVLTERRVLQPYGLKGKTEL